MVNISSKSQARRKVREAQVRANEARARRERDNVEDTATLLVAQGRLAGIDQWEAERIAQVRAEGDRRRQEHRAEAGAAIKRLQARGESLQTIAALAEMSVAEVRAFVKCAPAQRVSAPDAVTAGPHALGGGAEGGGVGGVA